MMRWIRGQAGRATALAIALALFGIARATTGDPPAAGTSLRFVQRAIAPAESRTDRRERPVNPRYARISGWISAVGAAVAISDIDGDGRPNDICLVDPRDDSVSVESADPARANYRRFALTIPADGYAPATVAPMGCLPGDFNEDGRTDLIVYFWGRPPLIYMASTAPMAPLRFAPTPLLAAHEAWYTNAALQADIDGDGHVDLLFGNYFPEDASVLDVAATDGGVMQHSMSRAFNGGRNRLFLARRDALGKPGFIDYSNALTREMTNGWTLALAAADLDGDLLPEIYVANDFGPDRLLVNLSTPGHPHFRMATGQRDLWTPRSRVLGRDSFKGMGAEFADINDDGRLDLAVSNIAQPYALLESHYLFINQGRPDLLKAGVAAFTDESGPSGIARSSWGWDIKAADFDNDGHPEMVQALGFMAGTTNRWPELQEVATANDDLLDRPEIWGAFAHGADLSGHERNRLYARDSAGIFHDVGVAAGVTRPGVTRGVAIADVDLDGRLDFAFARQWGQSDLLLNRSPHSGHFLSLDLRLPNANGTSRPAIGAVVRVDRAAASSMIGFVDGGNGHSGKSAPIVHFGLGASAAPVPVRVEWRDAAGVHEARGTFAPGHHRILLGRAKA